MKIAIKNFQKQIPIYPSRIKKAILRLLSQEKTKKPAEINILFVSDRKIKQLNFQYARKDATTDVLAFGDLECADIVVSADTARRNARLYNTSEQFEVCLYCLHGVLHILGFGDRRARERELMDKKAYAVLKNMGISDLK